MPESDGNLYAPPRADLRQPEDHTSRRIAWKLYFAFLLLLLPLAVLALALVARIQPADVIDTLAYCVALAGMFGYAFRRRVGARRFWGAWLPCYVVWEALLALVLEPRGLAYALPEGSEDEGSSLAIDLVSYALVAPLYVALLLYAHRSPEVWEEQGTR